MAMTMWGTYSHPPAAGANEQQKQKQPQPQQTGGAAGAATGTRAAATDAAPQLPPGCPPPLEEGCVDLIGSIHDEILVGPAYALIRCCMARGDSTSWLPAFAFVYGDAVVPLRATTDNPVPLATAVSSVRSSNVTRGPRCCSGWWRLCAASCAGWWLWTCRCASSCRWASPGAACRCVRACVRTAGWACVSMWHACSRGAGRWGVLGACGLPGCWESQAR